MPRWKWWPILNCIILTVRPGRKGKDYDKIWNTERNEGPLKTITRAQSRKAGGRASARRAHRRRLGHALRQSVDGEPRSPDLQAQGCDSILLVPLYPQYAAATTATACDQAFRALMQLRWQPAVRVAPPYYDEPAYIDALGAIPAPGTWHGSTSSPRR